jgi:hypothetical protein
MKTYSRPITAAPEKLVENGKYNLGCFNSPVRQANLLDYSCALQAAFAAHV